MKTSAGAALFHQIINPCAEKGLDRGPEVECYGPGEECSSSRRSHACGSIVAGAFLMGAFIVASSWERVDARDGRVIVDGHLLGQSAPS